LSPSSSLFRGRVEAPGPSDIEPLPVRDSAAARDLRELGLAAIARGAVAVVVLAGTHADEPIVDGASLLEIKIADARRAAREASGTVPVLIVTTFATHASIAKHLRARGLLERG